MSIKLINGLTFYEVDLEIIEKNIINKFSEYKKNLEYVLSKPKYIHIRRDSFNELELKRKLGEVLLERKISGDKIYKEFLNPNGDKNYCIFKVNLRDFDYKTGVYAYTLNDDIVYIGRSNEPFLKRFSSTGYTKISPKNCYKDGQSTNCKINSFINSNFEEIKLYIAPINENINQIETKLIKSIKPILNEK